MNVLKEIYESILNSTPQVPPETGEILGGKNNVITEFCADEGIGSNREFEYEPNTAKLNNVIEEWQSEEIEFYGIYHSHRLCGKTLSNSDKRYIDQIMQAVKENITQLYFPLVFPKENIICFRAELIDGETVIENEDINII